MNIYRTQENRFKNMKDYPFISHYAEINDLRMHYIDEGPEDADPILMMHGNPSWSYLYRFIIPKCAEAGNRVITPDLIGFGKSDKPGNIKDYSYQAHVDWMTVFIRSLDLKGITLFCQDWGALIGLRLAAENAQRFKGIIVGNGMLPTGTQKVPTVFKIWKLFSRLSPWLPIDRIIETGSLRKLAKEEKRAYRAPFPSFKYKTAVRAFPGLVPDSPENPAVSANNKAWDMLEKWHKPFLTAFSDGDPFTRGRETYMQNRIPGAKGQKHVTVHGGHFLQEDADPQLAEIINKFVVEINSTTKKRR